jgi:phosphonatase-like hydrolase
MSVSLVVFDMAGTTVYDGDAVHRCLARALETAGVEAGRDEINAVMGIAKPIAIRTVLEHHAALGQAVTSAQVDATYEAFLNYMRGYYESDPEVREIEGASGVFRQLRSAGVKVALDTGFSRDIVDVILHRLGWQSGELLDATIATDEVEQGRPHPDLIFRAMQLTGVEDAGRVAKVGDTPSDLQEGTAAGCGWVIGVTNGSHTRQELAPYLHTHLIDSLSELPAILL